MRLRQVYQAGSFVLCILIAWHITDGLDGTEFGGGYLTGPLLSMADIGMLLFAVAVVVTVLFPRVGAVLGLASSLLCLPLHCYFIAPIPFAQLFAPRAEFSVQPTPGFHWRTWPVTGLFVLGVAVYVCIRGIAGTNRNAISRRA